MTGQPIEPNDPGRIDIDLQLAGQTEIRSLVAAIGTLGEHVRMITSFAAEHSNQVEQDVVRGFGTESGVPFEHEVPDEAQQRLEDAARSRASDPSDTPTTQIPPSGSPSDNSSQAPLTEDERRANQERARDRLGGAGEPGPVGNIFDRMLRWALPDPYVHEVERHGLDPSEGASHSGEQIDPNAEDYHDVEQNLNVPQQPSGGPSLGASEGSNELTVDDPVWRHTLAQTGVNDPIRMPRFGEFTPQDYLRMAARPLAHYAEYRRAGAIEELGPDATPEEIAGVTAGQFSGRIAAGVGQFSQYMPYVHQAATRVFGLGQSPGVMGLNLNPNQIIQEQEQRGFSGGGATIQNLPGVGDIAEDLGVNLNLPAPIRLAATEAGREAVAEQVNRLRQRMNIPGLNTEEQYSIEGAITSTGRGLQGNEVREERMREVLYNALGQDSALNAADPNLLTSLYTQTEQLGLNNMTEFVDRLEKIPDAAAAANVGIDEMMTQMEEMGNFFQTIGGRVEQGQEFALDWGRTTGLAAPIGQAALSNPMIQGRIAAEHGILPQEVGMLPSGALTRGVYDQLDMLMNTFGNFDEDVTIDTSRGPVTIEGDQRKFAMVAEQMGEGWTPEAVERAWKGRKSTQALSELSLQASAWESGMRQTRPGTDARRRQLRSEDRSDDVISARELRQTMGDAGFNQNQLRSVAEKMRHSPQAGRAEIERITAKKTKRVERRLEREMSDRPTVDIQFVGEAKNWLEDARKGSDQRATNAKEARQGKRLANTLFRESGAPANKRERQNVVRAAQENPDLFKQALEWGWDDYETE